MGELPQQVRRTSNITFSGLIAVNVALLNSRPRSWEQGKDLISQFERYRQIRKMRMKLFTCVSILGVQNAFEIAVIEIPLNQQVSTMICVGKAGCPVANSLLATCLSSMTARWYFCQINLDAVGQMLVQGDICPLQIVPLDFFRRDELRSLTVASVTPRLGIPYPVQFLAAALWWRPGKVVSFQTATACSGPVRRASAFCQSGTLPVATWYTWKGCCEWERNVISKHES